MNINQIENEIRDFCYRTRMQIQDLDDKDQDAIHVFCWNDSDRVAGCLRVFWKDYNEAAGVAQIGRVVTLEHSKGIGSQMFHEGIRISY